MSNKLVLATGNKGKVREFQQLLSAHNIEVIAQTELNVPEVEETGLSFIENAIIKARNASEFTGLPAIADDSGLEVDALNGQPGIYSARYAGVDATDADNNRKLLDALKNISNNHRSARFQCALAYIRHAKDPSPIIFQGTWEGRILHEPNGENGFGYDPLFFIEEQNCTSAQLPPEIKNELSHRAKATKQLIGQMERIQSLSGYCDS